MKNYPEDMLKAKRPPYVWHHRQGVRPFQLKADVRSQQGSVLIPGESCSLRNMSLSVIQGKGLASKTRLRWKAPYHFGDLHSGIKCVCCIFFWSPFLLINTRQSCRQDQGDDPEKAKYRREKVEKRKRRF